MIKIAITGSTGLIGSRIQELLYHDFIFIPLLQSKIDITDKKSVEAFVVENDFDIMLHLAGYTAVDRAEKEREICKKINVDGTKYVFDATRKKKKKFIYISTDFVFSDNPPFYEDSRPKPSGWYAKTKYEGEKIVGEDGMIVRISYPYRAKFEDKKDFIRTIKSFLEEEKKLSLIADAFITPTFIDDIAHALKHLFVNFSNEIYHVVGSESLSPYEVGLKVAEIFSLNKPLLGKTSYDEFYKNNKIRAKDSTIKSKKNNFWKMKTLGEGLREIKRQTDL